MSTTTATEHVTAFQVQHGNVTITATKVGTSYWTFTWPGRGDDKANIWCDYERARSIAANLAEQVAELKPLRDEMDRRRADIAEWLREQSDEGPQ